MKSLFEGPTDGHGFAHGFHRYREGIVGSREFFKGKPGDFDDTVVYGGLEAGRGLLGDVIGYLVQGISYGQFGRDLGNGKPGCL